MTGTTGEIGIGIVGGGYMGKAHAVAMAAVGSVFDTALRPRLEMIGASTAGTAERYGRMYGFARSTGDYRVLVDDPGVEAVVIATPQSMHRAIAERALALGKPVFCEKPLGASLADSQAMVVAAASAGVTNMVGFNYIPDARLAICTRNRGVGGDRRHYLVPRGAHRGFPVRSERAGFVENRGRQHGHAR